MINVNVMELKTKLDNLKRLIEEYENIEINLFNQLKNSSISWEDANSIRFQDAIVEEKKESNEYVNNLKETINIFNEIYNSYINIGKKVKVNLNEKRNVLNSIENIKNKINNINKKINQINVNEVSEIRYKIKSVYDNINSLKEIYVSLYKKLENIESSIKNKLNKLENIKIKNLEVF